MPKSGKIPTGTVSVALYIFANISPVWKLQTVTVLVLGSTTQYSRTPASRYRQSFSAISIAVLEGGQNLDCQIRGTPYALGSYRTLVANHHDIRLDNRVGVFALFFFVEEPAIERGETNARMGYPASQDSRFLQNPGWIFYNPPTTPHAIITPHKIKRGRMLWREN